jgi:hypothetical protein
VLMVRDSARALGRARSTGRRDIGETALPAAIDWLEQTFEATGRKGSSKGFSLLYGWLPPFPETTGYVIGTLLEYSERSSQDRYASIAREMGDWELEVQEPDGGIREGVLDKTPRRSEAFNTGMVLHGWLDLAEQSYGDSYLAAAERAGRFLIAAQDDDGAWRGDHSHHRIPHTYMSRVAWALVRLSTATGDREFATAARRHLDWVVSMQRDNAWFDACAFKPNALPNTHGLAYTLRGLLESSALLGDERYLTRAAATSEVLLEKMHELGPLPAVFDSDWQPACRYVCLTGLVQLGGVWLRLYQHTDDGRFREAGLKAIELAADKQESVSWLPVRGALPGSFPIYGRYAPLQYPNWATKFLADSLMLRELCKP